MLEKYIVTQFEAESSCEDVDEVVGMHASRTFVGGPVRLKLDRQLLVLLVVQLGSGGRVHTLLVGFIVRGDIAHGSW